MILNALYELYGRLAEQGVELPRMGMSSQKIGFRIIITSQGGFVRIEDARAVEVVVKKGKKGNTEKSRPVVREQMVPGEGKPPGSGVNPCFLWDNAAYLLGCVAVKPRALEYFAETRRKHLEVEPLVNSPKFAAVCRFLEQWKPERCETEFANKDLFTTNGVFRIQGDEVDVHEDALIAKWWAEYGNTHWRNDKGSGGHTGFCLITGREAPIAVLHNPPIKGVRDAQSSGAKLVSFNQTSFNSYGKEQSYNSPVSEEAAFAYCNALNYLLGRRECRLQVADATTVFWTDSPQETREEDELFVASSLDAGGMSAMDEALVERVRSRVEAIAAGRPVEDVLQQANHVRFYILGLSPNAARLSVRFFHESTLGDFARNLQAHFAAMAIQPRGEKFNDSPIITPYLILRETVRDQNDLPPLYSGSLMRAILSGLPYPDVIALAIQRRIRVDGNVNYVRCAYLKAWLTRKSPLYQITPMLDTNNTQPGYVLGRLFAALVKTQEDVLPNLNRTIKDAFYASASSTPQYVFPRILKLHLHHLAKLEGGRRVNRERQVQEIMASLSGFPARLNMEQQAFFALGYYHQTQDFYKPKTNE